MGRQALDKRTDGCKGGADKWFLGGRLADGRAHGQSTGLHERRVGRGALDAMTLYNIMSAHQCVMSNLSLSQNTDTLFSI